MPSEPKLITRDAFTVAGIEVRTDNAREMNPATARIAGLWQRFFQENIPGTLPNKKPAGVPLGIYTDYESDHTGVYTLIAAIATTQAGAAPAGMRAVTIPAGKYLVFTASGTMPQALIETWGAVWTYFSSNPRYMRAYTTDFEEYLSSDKVAVYIAVK